MRGWRRHIPIGRMRETPPPWWPRLEEERPLCGRRVEDPHWERLLERCCCWGWDVFWGADIKDPFCFWAWLAGGLKPLLERPLDDDLGLWPFLEERSMAFSICSSSLSTSATLGKTSPSKRSERFHRWELGQRSSQRWSIDGLSP